MSRKNVNHLLDNIRAKLLNREGTDVADELTDNGVAEAVVVEIKDVLDHL